jgi:hypothetical protein
MCGSLEYGIRNFVFYQPECHNNVMEIVALPKLYHSQNPGLQNLRTAITSFLASHQQHKKHAFTLSVALTLYPIMDVANTLIPSEKYKTASRSVYDVEPYPWQAQFGGSIIKSVLTNSPKVNLLVASTGGGKSLVRDVCGLCFGGVNLTIVPLLSLGTDQASKGFQKPRQDQGVVTAFHPTDGRLSNRSAKTFRQLWTKQKLYTSST